MRNVLFHLLLFVAILTRQHQPSRDSLRFNHPNLLPIRVIDLVEKFVSNFEQKTAAFEPDEVDHSNEAMAHSCYVLCCEVENSAKAIIDTATSNRTQSSPITMFPFGSITRPSDLEDLGRQDFFTAFYRPIEGGQCRVVKKATNYEDALECLKVAERVEILNLARQDRDKEVRNCEERSDELAS